MATASGNSGYTFKRIVWSLVRDGTRLKTAIEGVERGCFLTVSDYAREVLDGRRQSCYGVWVESRVGPDPAQGRKRV